MTRTLLLYHIHITEIALFLRNLGMEHRLHKHVAALLFHIVGVLSVDCVDKFVCLFDEVDSYTLVGLRSVPFAAVVDSASSAQKTSLGVAQNNQILGV